MTSYETELRNKWNNINYFDGGSLKIEVKHTLEWYVRYAAQNQKSLVIVSDTPVNSISSSKSIEASCNIRQDGRYAICFTLVSIEQEDVFIAMSSDIIEYSSGGQTPDESLKKVLTRYAAWLKLLDHKRSSEMSVEAQKGLLAELLFLKSVIEKGTNPSDAVSGWVGPDGSDQDFVYDNGWHEIKATGASSVRVTISSVEQLDNIAMAGELVVYRIDKCAPAHIGAISLYSIVHALFEMMQIYVDTLNEFVLKLGAVGYIDSTEYDKQHFCVSSRQSYAVDDTFPKIIRSGLPIEIANAEYQLDLPSLNAWAK